MAGPVLAIDAGSTSVRALVVDANLEVLGRAQVRADVHSPAPGRVEQDAAQLWSATETVIGRALSDAGIARGRNRGDRHYRAARQRGGVGRKDG